MDRLQVKKNVLDIRERTHRLYFTTQALASIIMLSVIVTLLLTVSPTSQYYVLLQVSVVPSAILLYNSFEHKKMADETIEKIEGLVE
ncbi:MAG: hypothetical protein HYS81_04170 [Candidatus Aenigmatarchaeota archaeon]|nr:MAG: hypothetical protein HYS81_04170 [Candidatus Aenigmarchaeota archaeon]